VIIADDGDVETPVPDDHPYGVFSYRPSLNVFAATSMEKVKTIDLPVNGALVHIEQGLDGRIYGGAEQFVYRDETGREILEGIIGANTGKYLDGISYEQYLEEVPLPGPIVGVDLASGEATSHTRMEHSDPFDIRLNQETETLLSVYSTSDQLARLDPHTGEWSYTSTRDFNIREPFGLIDIPGSSLMAVNGFEQGIAIFDAANMQLVRYFDVPTHGMKHMLYQG